MSILSICILIKIFCIFYFLNRVLSILVDHFYLLENYWFYWILRKFSYSHFLLRYALQQLSQQNDMIPMTELEYFTPSTRLLNSFLHEIQFEYI